MLLLLYSYLMIVWLRSCVHGKERRIVTIWTKHWVPNSLFLMKIACHSFHEYLDSCVWYCPISMCDCQICWWQCRRLATEWDEFRVLMMMMDNDLSMVDNEQSYSLGNRDRKWCDWWQHHPKKLYRLQWMMKQSGRLSFAWVWYHIDDFVEIGKTIRTSQSTTSIGSQTRD